MPEKQYTIGELVEKTGVAKRTITFWRKERLFPAPARDGRRSLYGEEHCSRIVAIKKLQAQGLTLGEIRQRLGIGAQKGEPRRDPAGALPLARMSRKVKHGRSEASAGARTAAGSDAEDWLAVPWIRIEINADLEMHVRNASSASVGRLVAAVRQVLKSERGNL